MHQAPGLISNEYRTSSISIPSVEAEMLEQRGGGDDPLEILCRLEDDHGYVSYEAIELSAR